MKRMLMMLIFAVSLSFLPGIAFASQRIPVVFCGPTLSLPFVNIDCAGTSKSKVAKVDARKVSLRENKPLPRSASAARPVFGGLADSLRELIRKIARALGMDPRILEAVAQAESGGNQAAVSPKGAIGVMQLMPGTARGLGVNPYDTEQNILGGGIYLKKQMDRFGSLPLALAAYNAGPGAVEKYGGIPPYKETRQYIANVLSMMGGD